MVHPFGKWLSKNRLHDLPLHVGQAKVAALRAEGQAFVVDAHLMEDGRVQIVDVDRIFNSVVTEFVRPTVGQSRFHPTSGEPHGEGMGMMISSPGFP